MTKVTEWLKAHPKVSQTFWLVAAGAAGAHGGPVAASAVRNYGPTFAEYVAKALGG